MPVHRASRWMVFVLVGFASLASACQLPTLDEEQAAANRLAQTSFLYDANAELITELHAGENRVVVPLKRIPQVMQEAVIAIEDRRFYQHKGIDLKALLRAAYIDATTGRIVEGGSTITQQLVKTIYTGSAQTLDRKIREASLAWQLEKRYTKDQILSKYLNTVYFGAGAYGVQAAARTYFAHDDASRLGLADAALLAGLVQAPSTYDPFHRPNVAKRRRDVVLDAMLDQEMISKGQRRKAMKSDLGLELRPEDEERTIAPYFVDYFKDWFLNNQAFGETQRQRYRLLFSGGLRITTTLVPKYQEAAERAVSSVLVTNNDPYGALTSLDPRTGHVVAMVGGRDYYASRGADRYAKINLAVGGSLGRPAGSAFKPFTLVAALESGLPTTKVYPAPGSISIPIGEGEPWRVSNADEASSGSLTIEQATIGSVNTVFAQIIKDVGPEKVAEVAQRMGIRCCRKVSQPAGPLQPYYSNALGASDVNSLEMASAYGTLANGGYHVQPVPASLITDSRGQILWRAEPRPRLAVEPKIVQTVDGILQKAVLYGTGTAANLGRPQIGKTGTGQEYRDAWFAGSVPQLTTVVWVGFPEGQVSMQPPRTRITVFGGTWPAEIWRAYMSRATAGMPQRPFPTGEVRYVTVRIDATQDCLPNAFTLPENIDEVQFIDGTEPTKTCEEPSSAKTVEVPSVIGMAQSRGEELLTQAGFYIDVRADEKATQPRGTVVAQSPQAGERAKQTTTIVITVSKRKGGGQN